MSEAHLITAGFGIAAAPSQSAYRSPLSPFFLDSFYSEEPVFTYTLQRGAHRLAPQCTYHPLVLLAMLEETLGHLEASGRICRIPFPLHGANLF